MLSMHPSIAAGYPNAGFLGFECFDLRKLCDYVTRNVYSPCIWAGGSRNEWKFRAAYWCALDFDDTLTKLEAVEALRGYKYVLAPSRNDGKDKYTSTGKLKPARDRFRVLMPFKHIVYDKDVFSYNMRLAIKRFDSDPLPYDAGRIWQPSSTIEILQEEGECLDVKIEVPIEETQSFRQQQIADYATSRAKGHAWPKRVLRFIDGSVTEGERNSELFFTACFLFQAGWTVEAVRKLVADIPEMHGHDKTESTLKSAAKRTGAAFF